MKKGGLVGPRNNKQRSHLARKGGKSKGGIRPLFAGNRWYLKVSGEKKNGKGRAKSFNIHSWTVCDVAEGKNSTVRQGPTRMKERDEHRKRGNIVNCVGGEKKSALTADT